MSLLSIIIPSKTDANLGACVRAIRGAGETATVIVVDDFDDRPGSSCRRTSLSIGRWGRSRSCSPATSTSASGRLPGMWCCSTTTPCSGRRTGSRQCSEWPQPIPSTASSLPPATTSATGGSGRRTNSACETSLGWSASYASSSPGKRWTRWACSMNGPSGTDVTTTTIAIRSIVVPSEQDRGGRVIGYRRQHCDQTGMYIR